MQLQFNNFNVFLPVDSKRALLQDLSASVLYKTTTDCAQLKRPSPSSKNNKAYNNKNIADTKEDSSSSKEDIRGRGDTISKGDSKDYSKTRLAVAKGAVKHYAVRGNKT